MRRRKQRPFLFATAFAGFGAIAFACTSFNTDQVSDEGRDGAADTVADVPADAGGPADARDDGARDAVADAEVDADALAPCTYVTSVYSGSSSSSSGAGECVETDTFTCGTMTCACYVDGGGSCRCDGGASFKHACATAACSPTVTELSKCGFPPFDAGGGTGSSSSSGI